ncbi:hypothetical protein Tco_0741767 [Tanacetum coccineum]
MKLFKAYGLTQASMADCVTQSKKYDPKANMVVSQTYLRHLFEEGNLSVHIILHSHVPSWTSTADFQVALKEADSYVVIFRLLGNKAMLLLTSLF